MDTQFVLEVHCMNNPEMVQRCLYSILENILNHGYEPNHFSIKGINNKHFDLPDITILLLDDERKMSRDIFDLSRQAQQNLNALWSGRRNPFTENIPVQVRYVNKWNNIFRRQLEQKVKSAGLSQEDVSYFFDNGQYRGSMNYGNAYAMWQAGLHTMPLQNLGVWHIDMDETFFTLRQLKMPDGTVKYRLEQGPDHIGARYDLFKQGYSIIGNKYLGHSGSPLNMLRELLETVSMVLDQVYHGVAETKNSGVLFVENSDTSNFVYRELTYGEFMQNLPWIIQAQLQRTPIIKLRDESKYLNRDTEDDIKIPPIHKLVRGNLVPKAYDPIDGPIHDVIAYIMYRAVLNDDSKICRSYPTFHFRSATHGNEFQGKNLLDAIAPGMIETTFVLAEMSLDRSEVFERARGNLLELGISSLYGHFDEIRELYSRIKVKLNSMLNNPEYTTVRQKLGGCQEQFEIQSYHNQLEELNEFLSVYRQNYEPQIHRALAFQNVGSDAEAKIKSYFDHLPQWERLCHLSYEIGTKMKTEVR